MGAVTVVTPGKKMNIVLHLLGPDVQEIVDTLPEVEGSGDAYQRLKSKLDKHFKL